MVGEHVVIDGGLISTLVNGRPTFIGYLDAKKVGD